MGRTREAFYAWLVPRLVLPLSERLGGRRMWTEVCRLRELQWRSQAEIEARAVEKLRQLLSHAGTHVPYYRDLFKRTGIEPEDVRTLLDLAAVPITTKTDLRSNFPLHTVADNLPAHRRRRMMTSGSTGLPFEFYWDRASADALLGAYLFSLEWAGVGIWDTRVAIASPLYFYTNVIDASRFRQMARWIALGERTVNLSAIDLTAAKFQTVVHRFGRQGRYFLRGYPSSTVHLARQLLEAGTELPAYPKAVITYAETLTATNAASLRRAFRCEIVNYYSSWEVPQMAQTCPDNPEVLHVNTERVILRVVRPDGTTASPGEPGRVVVTDLANYVMPFINYGIGDHAVAGPLCSCGRGLPILTRLEGRDTEVIQAPGGKQINGGVLGQFLAFVIGIIPYIWEYQAVQSAPDEVMLRVVPTSRFTPEFARRLQGELAAFLGPGVRVAIEPVDRIPLEPSGKRLIIKSLLTQG
jgi:phenylacetate-CoA ligase